jgi:H+/Cl- antiporter ClcA
MPDDNLLQPRDPQTETTDFARIGGYLVFLTIVGASIGRRIAQVQPIDPFKRTARRMAESQTLDQMIPFVIVGAIIGLVCGLFAERLLPKWRNAYWLYGTIGLLILWATTLGMPPWMMP